MTKIILILIDFFYKNYSCFLFNFLRPYNQNKIIFFHRFKLILNKKNNNLETHWYKVEFISNKSLSF